MRVRLLALLGLLALLPVLFGMCIVVLWAAFGWGVIPVLLLTLLAGAWGLKVLVSRAFQILMEAPFRMKGAALRGARVEVHEVVRTGPGGRSLCIDATIYPAATGKAASRAWELGELLVVPAETKSGPREVASGEEGCRVEMHEIWRDGEWVADQGDKITGPCRIRMHARVPGGAAEVAFRYYFEVFGRIQTPAERAADLGLRNTSQTELALSRLFSEERATPLPPAR